MARAARTSVEPLVRKTPGVSGGDACVGRTSIPVWMLVNGRRLGLDDAQILAGCPGLTAGDLEAARSYCAGNTAEVDAAIARNEGL